VGPINEKTTISIDDPWWYIGVSNGIPESKAVRDLDRFIMPIYE
ncbi:14034_t:CDS:1, partial [Cetraspora pellucida]